MLYALRSSSLGDFSREKQGEAHDGEGDACEGFECVFAYEGDEEYAEERSEQEQGVER